MDNIRPAEAFNLARKTPNCIYFACFFDKTLIECVKSINFGPWICQKKFLARHEI